MEIKRSGFYATKLGSKEKSLFPLKSWKLKEAVFTRQN